jgi:hypothetical protein
LMEYFCQDVKTKWKAWTIWPDRSPSFQVLSVPGVYQM